MLTTCPTTIRNHFLVTDEKMASTSFPSYKLSRHPSQLELENMDRYPSLSARPSREVETVSSRALQPPVAPTAQKPVWVSGVRLLNVIAAVTLVCLLMLLDSSIIVTAVPRITVDFHSLPDIGWYGSAYQLARCVSGLHCRFAG